MTPTMEHLFGTFRRGITMKSAILYIDSVVVCCPHCKVIQAEPGSGSHIWTTDDIADKRTVICSSCSKEFLINPLESNLIKRKTR